MKLGKSLVLITSLLTMLLMSIFPVLRILIDIKQIQSIYLSFGAIFYLLALILLILFSGYELIIFIKYAIQNKIKNKVLWIILLLTFNIFVFPYFNTKIIHKEEGNKVLSLIYIIPLLLYSFILVYGYIVYTDLNNQKIEEQRKIDEERNTYTTKDGKTSFTFRHGYIQKEVGEYDLYVINEEKPLVFSVFTYNTIDYEQKSAVDYLNKGVEDIKQNKTKFELFTDLKEIKKEGYTVNQVKYEAESEIQTSTKISTSICIYTISVITFDADPNYMIFTIEVVPKAVYESVSAEADEILNSVTFQ